MLTFVYNVLAYYYVYMPSESECMGHEHAARAARRQGFDTHLFQQTSQQKPRCVDILNWQPVRERVSLNISLRYVALSLLPNVNQC